MTAAGFSRIATQMPGEADRQTPPRTLLEQLVRQSRRTIEENCAAFEKTARTNGEDATLAARTLSRWISGNVRLARPVCQRVAQLHWGYDWEALVGPPAHDRFVAPAAAQPVEAASPAVQPLGGEGVAVQLVVMPGTVVIVVPADHPVLVALGAVGGQPSRSSGVRQSIAEA